MNRAYAGRPRMTWYCDGQSTTSNSIVSRLKSSGVLKTMSRLIFPMGIIGFPGSTPWKVVSCNTPGFKTCFSGDAACQNFFKPSKIVALNLVT